MGDGCSTLGTALTSHAVKPRFGQVTKLRLASGYSVPAKPSQAVSRNKPFNRLAKKGCLLT